MNTKYLKTLEYDKIIHKLSTYCKTYVGKENIDSISPEFNADKVSNLLKATNEAISLIFRKGNIPLSDIPNISSTKLMKNFSNSALWFMLPHIGCRGKVSQPP